MPPPVLSPPAWALGKRVLPQGLELPPWLAGWQEPPPVVALWLGPGVVVAQRGAP